MLAHPCRPAGSEWSLWLAQASLVLMLLHGDDFPVRLGLARGDANKLRVGVPGKAAGCLRGPRLPSGTHTLSGNPHPDGSLWMLCGLPRESES